MDDNLGWLKILANFLNNQNDFIVKWSATQKTEAINNAKNSPVAPPCILKIIIFECKKLCHTIKNTK